MRSAIENDPTKELTQFLKSDIEKQREHELKLFQLLLSNSNPNPQPQYHHHGDYVSPSRVNQGLSMPPPNFGSQSDYVLWRETTSHLDQYQYPMWHLLPLFLQIQVTEGVLH